MKLLINLGRMVMIITIFLIFDNIYSPLETFDTMCLLLNGQQRFKELPAKYLDYYNPIIIIQEFHQILFIVIPLL